MLWVTTTGRDGRADLAYRWYDPGVRNGAGN